MLSPCPPLVHKHPPERLIHHSCLENRRHYYHLFVIFFLRWSTTGWAAGSSLKMYTIFFFFLISQVLGRGEGRWYPHLGRKGWEAHSAKVIYLPVGLAQEPWVPQTDHQ